LLGKDSALGPPKSAGFSVSEGVSRLESVTGV
jgi:hypothetical protein